MNFAGPVPPFYHLFQSSRTPTLPILGQRGGRIMSHSVRHSPAAPLYYIGRRCALRRGGRYLATLLPPLLPPLRVPASSPWRASSWSSFREMTVSQKWTTACYNLSLPSMALTSAGSERSGPTTAERARRSSIHAGHSLTVCDAVSIWASQWWHRIVRSSTGTLQNSHVPS